MQLIYVFYAFLAHELNTRGIPVLMLGVLVGKLFLEKRKLDFSLMLIILGLLNLLEFKLFLQAFTFSTLSQIQALLILKIGLGLIVKNGWDFYGFGILICFFLLLSSVNWQLALHSLIMGFNYSALQLGRQVDREFMVHLIGIFWILLDFKSISYQNLDFIGGLWVLAGVFCDFRNLEGSRWYCLASLIVSTLSGFIFKENISNSFMVYTILGHLLWFLSIKHQDKLDKAYKELPISIEDSSKTVPTRVRVRKKIRWLVMVIFTSLVLVYNFRDFKEDILHAVPFMDQTITVVQNSTYLSPSQFSQDPTLPPKDSKVVLKTKVQVKDLDKYFKLDLKKQENACDKMYGHTFLRNFKDSKTTVCPAKEDKGTSIDCYFHGGRAGVSGVDEEVLCEIEYYKMDLKLISDFHFPPNSKLDFWDLQSIQKTTLGTCKLNLSSVKDRVHSEEPSAYLLNSFKTIDHLDCQEYFNKTILFVSRWDTTNLYHATEDFLQAWVTLLVAGIDPKNTMVIRLDTKAMGPFTSFFNYALSDQKSPLKDKDLINIVDWAKNQSSACFSRAVFGIFAVPSPVSYEMYRFHPNPTSCGPPDTGIFTSFKDFMIDAYNFLPDSKLPTRKQVHLAYITRKGFLRYIRNEDKLLKSISETVCGTRENCELVLEVFDFQKLSFYEQLSVARNTDILLGMHGAALTSSIYLRNTAALIEIGHPSRSSNRHFNNLARFMGLRYHIIDGDDFLSDSEIVAGSNAVKEEFDHMLKLNN